MSLSIGFCLGRGRRRESSERKNGRCTDLRQVPFHFEGVVTVSDVRTELEAMLREFPAIRVEKEGDTIVAICPGENTFKVALLTSFDERVR
jgi:hypothetical protein